MSEQNERVLDQFSQQAEAYAVLVNATSQPSVDPLIELTAPRSNDRVLDVGCGTGQFVVRIASSVAHAVGVDLTPAMLDQARAHQSRERVSNVSWEQADSTALPFEDGSFTLVVSRSMLHHAADPLATLAEMRRVCNAVGRLAVMDLSPDATRAPAFDAFELLRDPSHARTLTNAELRQMGQHLGLKELQTRTRTSSLPLDAVLATSFPSPGMLERVRALLMRDLHAGGNAFGLSPEIRDGKLWVTYPMTVVVWQR
jgi:ubiquinone/menaquinone biosynthesis C-methylase UbiE